MFSKRAWETKFRIHINYRLNYTFFFLVLVGTREGRRFLNDLWEAFDELNLSYIVVVMATRNY
jgi:hypothetical protein